MAVSTISTVLLLSAIVVAAAIYFHVPPQRRQKQHRHHRRNAPPFLHARPVHRREPHGRAHRAGRLPLSSSNATTTGSDDDDDEARRFGDIAMMNNALTEGPDRSSPRVGTAQGFTVRVAERGSVNALSMHLVMEAGELAGSSLVVGGRVDTDLAVRESVIVGGTGRFRLARGYALSRSYDYDLAKGGVVEVDVYLQ